MSCQLTFISAQGFFKTNVEIGFLCQYSKVYYLWLDHESISECTWICKHSFTSQLDSFPTDRIKDFKKESIKTGTFKVFSKISLSTKKHLRSSCKIYYINTVISILVFTCVSFSSSGATYRGIRPGTVGMKKGADLGTFGGSLGLFLFC